MIPYTNKSISNIKSLIDMAISLWNEQSELEMAASKIAIIEIPYKFEMLHYESYTE